MAEDQSASRSDEALLPCPFCGGKASFGTGASEGVGGHFIECGKCNASTALVFPLKDDVTRELLDRWNARSIRSERPLIPEGWKLVPVEATAAMTFAGLAAHPDLGATGIWQAMYDAAPSEAGAERDPNDPDPVEHARELAAALIAARKELVEIRPEAARYRWLRGRTFGADFEHSSIEQGAGWALIFCMPEGATISANLDKSLDEAMASSNERSDSTKEPK